MDENDFGETRLQVRCQYDTVNRKYGLAIELRAPSDLTAWLNDQTPTHKSPASGSMLYIPISLYHYVEHEETVQLLINGEELNHPSGAMLDVSQESPAVETLVQFVKESQSGIVVEAGVR